MSFWLCHDPPVSVCSQDLILNRLRLRQEHLIFSRDSPGVLLCCCGSKKPQKNHHPAGPEAVLSAAAVLVSFLTIVVLCNAAYIYIDHKKTDKTTELSRLLLLSS